MSLSKFEEAYLREHFLRNNDYSSKVWHFQGGERLQSLPIKQKYSIPNHPWYISIIDPYGNRKPLLYCKQTWQQEDIPMKFMFTLLLDSQVWNATYGYMNGDVRNKNETQIIRSFLGDIIQYDLDISDMFYVVESLAKAGKDHFDYLRKKVEACIRLKVANKELFYHTGILDTDPKLLRAQLEYHNFSSLEEYVDSHMNNLSNKKHLIPQDKIELSYIVILKIALIQSQESLKVREKVVLLNEFIYDNIGLILAPELFVAICIFSNPEKHAKFIPKIQQKINIDKFLRRCMSSAWDLLLSRLPSRFLNAFSTEIASFPIECNLMYICTADNALRDLVTCQKIHTVFDLPQNLGGPRCSYEYNMEYIYKTLGKEVYDEIERENIRFDSKMLQEKRKTPPTYEALVKLRTELESEIRALV